MAYFAEVSEDCPVICTNIYVSNKLKQNPWVKNLFQFTEHAKHCYSKWFSLDNCGCLSKFVQNKGNYGVNLAIPKSCVNVKGLCNSENGRFEQPKNINKEIFNGNGNHDSEEEFTTRYFNTMCNVDEPSNLSCEYLYNFVKAHKTWKNRHHLGVKDSNSSTLVHRRSHTTIKTIKKYVSSSVKDKNRTDKTPYNDDDEEETNNNNNNDNNDKKPTRESPLLESLFSPTPETSSTEKLRLSQRNCSVADRDHSSPYFSAHDHEAVGIYSTPVCHQTKSYSWEYTTSKLNPLISTHSSIGIKGTTETENSNYHSKLEDEPATRENSVENIFTSNIQKQRHTCRLPVSNDFDESIESPSNSKKGRVSCILSKFLSWRTNTCAHGSNCKTTDLSSKASVLNLTTDLPKCGSYIVLASPTTADLPKKDTSKSLCSIVVKRFSNLASLIWWQVFTELPALLLVKPCPLSLCIKIDVVTILSYMAYKYCRMEAMRRLKWIPVWAYER